MTKKQVVLVSPFLIILINVGVAYGFGSLIGKWAFIPIILFSWAQWLFFIFKFGGIPSIKKWLQKPRGKFWWALLAVFIGLIPLPLFILHSDTLSHWSVWLPWILLALINPWIEESYWRGLLIDYSKDWKTGWAILYSSAVFALSHLVFGINSEVNSGIDLIISTFIMGLVWGLVYVKTKSLRWVIFAHFLVDFFNLSAAAFLDLFDKGSW